jgi:hypothetical protein
MNEDTTSPALAVTVTDPDDALATLNVTATSDNTVVLPAGGVLLSGSAGTYTLRLTPAAEQSGFSTVTVSATDAAGNNSTRSFLVTVIAVNDAPTLNLIADLALPFSSAPRSVALAGIGSGAANETQTLTVTATSSDTSIVAPPAVTYASPAATGSLLISPLAGISGSSTITVTVRDGGDTAGGGINTLTRTFVVTVAPLPVLTVQWIAGKAVLSWPGSAGAGWSLQGSANPTDTSAWANVGTAPVLSGGQYSVTNSSAQAALFFRLRQP